MPSVSTTLADIEQSVARPIIFTIINQVFDITGLSKDTEVIYAGVRNIVRAPGTTIDDEGAKDAKFQAGRMTFVEVDETYNPAAMQEIHTHSFEHIPVFEDIALRFSLRPIYTTSDVEIKIRYRSNSETEVRRWQAEMLLKASRGQDVNLHTVEYSYPLPYGFMMLANDVWGLREAVAGYGQSFKEYLLSHSTDRLTVLSNQAGEYGHLAVKEKQTRIQGFFDFVGVPEKPSRDEESGTWEINFVYKFNYQRPDAVFVHYPVSVHNQLIPHRYVEHIGSEPDPFFQNKVYSKSYAALNRFEADTLSMHVRSPNPIIKIPAYDDFKPTNIAPGTASIITALCFIEEDKRTLLDLNDLDEFVIDQDVVVFLRAEYPYMTKLYHSVFHIALYCEEYPMVDGSIEVTPELVVKATKDLDPRKVYHLRISMMAEVQMLVQSALDRLALFPKAFTKIFSAINDLLRINPDFNLLSHRNFIEPWELTSIYRILTGGLRTNAMGFSTPLVSYEADSLNKWPYGLKNGFLSDIDQRVVNDYLRQKRRGQLTVMFAGIIVHKVSLDKTP
jgi:hypothetical protein